MGDEEVAGNEEIEDYAQVEVGARVVVAAEADEDAVLLKIFDDEAEVHYDCKRQRFVSWV